MKLAYPLNDVLPNIEHTRDRLLAKVFEFRHSGLGKVIAKDEDYELLYAYGKLSTLLERLSACLLTLFIALVTAQLANNLNTIGQEIEKLYGVLNEEDLKLQ
jgi:hypothetical protein